MQNVQFYIYFEDEALTVGIRSLEPFEGADFDGEFHFTYLEGDHFHRSTFAPFEFESVPESDGVHIYVGGELQDILGYEEDAPSVYFELQLTEQK